MPLRPVVRSTARRACPGSSRRFAVRPGRAVAGDDEQAAAALDEPLQRAAAGGRRQRRVVQDDDGALVERRRASRATGDDVRPETPASCRSPAPSSRNRLASARSPLSTIATDTGSLGESTKWKVLSAGSGSVPARTMPRTFGFGQRERRERHRRRRVRRDGRALGLDLVAVDRQRRPARSSTGCVALVAEPGRDRDALLARERRAREGDRRDRRGWRCSATRPTSGVSVMPSGKRASSEPLQPVFWKSLISTASRRLSGERLRMLSRQLQRRAVARGVRADLRRVDGRLEPRRDPTSRACSLRRSVANSTSVA